MISILDVINICNGELICGDESIICENFSKDTRTINKGDIYVGIKGETFDGNTFYKEAFNKGSKACILDNNDVIKDTEGMTIVLVDDSIKAIQELAKYKRSLYDIPVVAITGSVGKTSVKDMVSQVLMSEYKVLYTKENFNNYIGLPLTILGLKDHEVMVVEMGMNQFNELHVLSNIAKPNIAIITNIGTAHIGNLGSRENILKAKLEILDGMTDGLLIINNDNDLLRTVEYDNLVTIGIDNDSDYVAHDIEYDAFSTGFYINDNYFTIPIGSSSFVYNALFSYAVARKLGISDDNIKEALRNFKLSPHRLEVINKEKITIIDDTYNASLDSVKSSLSLLKKIDTRKVFIFADMLELEEYGEDIHREVGEACNDNDLDILIAVGDLAKYAYEEFMGEKYHFSNNQELLKEINTIIDDGDTILIKGSHGMNLLEVVEYLKRTYQ